MEQPRQNAKFPLPGSHPFALLYRRVAIGLSPSATPWRLLGNTIDLTHTSAPAILQFRTKDDRPRNGNGQFDCTITIQRT